MPSCDEVGDASGMKGLISLRVYGRLHSVWVHFDDRFDLSFSHASKPNSDGLPQFVLRLGAVVCICRRMLESVTATPMQLMK